MVVESGERRRSRLVGLSASRGWGGWARVRGGGAAGRGTGVGSGWALVVAGSVAVAVPLRVKSRRELRRAGDGRRSRWPSRPTPSCGWSSGTWSRRSPRLWGGFTRPRAAERETLRGQLQQLVVRGGGQPLRRRAGQGGVLAAAAGRDAGRGMVRSGDPPTTVFTDHPDDRRGHEALLLVRFHDYVVIDDVRAEALPRGPSRGPGPPTGRSSASRCSGRRAELPGHAVGGRARAAGLRRHRPQRHVGHGPAAGSRSCRPPLKLAAGPARPTRRRAMMRGQVVPDEARAWTAGLPLATDYFAHARREACANAAPPSAAACAGPAGPRLALRIAKRHADLGEAERAEHALQHRPGVPLGLRGDRWRPRQPPSSPGPAGTARARWSGCRTGLSRGGRAGPAPWRTPGSAQGRPGPGSAGPLAG